MGGIAEAMPCYECLKPHRRRMPESSQRTGSEISFGFRKLKQVGYPGAATLDNLIVSDKLTRIFCWLTSLWFARPRFAIFTIHL